MAFDGQRHGIGGLITPYYHAPGAPALPDSLGQALRHSYAMARMAQPLGNLAYPITHRSASFVAPPSVATTFEERWRWPLTYAPPLATAVLMHVSYSLLAGLKVQALQRVVVTDGASTDIGSAHVSEEADIAEHPLVRDVYDGFRVQGMLLPLETVDTQLPLTVSVEAFANDENGNPVMYRPAIASAWWILEG